MRVFSLLMVSGLLAASGFAQTSADYLKLRNQQHIVQPTPGEKLDNLVGQSVVEIQGVVQGSFKSGPNMEFMVKREDGADLTFDCQTDPPDWLSNGEVPVRLLLHVNRPAKYDQLEAHLICAAPEAEISKVDEAYWKGEAAKAQVRAEQVKTSPRAYNSASRGGGGDMHGWIGGARRNMREYTTSDAILQAYREFILRCNHKLPIGTADKIAKSVIAYSGRYGVDARLVMSVIIAESNFHPLSTSRVGAAGLGQLMPGTAAWMGVSNPYDLEQNLYGTIKLLRTHMDEYHVSQYPAKSEAYYAALGLVLAAYNAGDGAVRKYGGIPPFRETQNYVSNVLRTFQRLTSADG